MPRVSNARAKCRMPTARRTLQVLAPAARALRACRSAARLPKSVRHLGRPLFAPLLRLCAYAGQPAACACALEAVAWPEEAPRARVRSRGASPAAAELSSQNGALSSLVHAAHQQPAGAGRGGQARGGQVLRRNLVRQRLPRSLPVPRPETGCARLSRPNVAAQTAFEKTLFTKTSRVNARGERACPRRRSPAPAPGSPVLSVALCCASPRARLTRAPGTPAQPRSLRSTTSSSSTSSSGTCTFTPRRTQRRMKSSSPPCSARSRRPSPCCLRACPPPAPAARKRSAPPWRRGTPALHALGLGV